MCISHQLLRGYTDYEIICKQQYREYIQFSILKSSFNLGFYKMYFSLWEVNLN